MEPWVFIFRMDLLPSVTNLEEHPPTTDTLDLVCYVFVEPVKSVGKVPTGRECGCVTSLCF